MSNKADTALVKETLVNWSKQLGEPEWLQEIRLKGLDKYFELVANNVDASLISIGEEEDLSEVHLNLLPEQLQYIINSNTDNRSIIVYKNNTVLYKHLSAELLRQGVNFTTLDNAVRKYPALVRKYFLQSIEIAETPELALHSALWNDGIFLFVPENVVIDSPIQVVFIGTESRLMPHTIVVAGENSSFTYVDLNLSISEEISAQFNSVSEIYLERGANVEIFSNHSFNENLSDYTHRQATVAEDANLEWIISEMNSGKTNSNNLFTLEGEHAKVEAKTIFVGAGDQRCNFTTKAMHDAPETTSEIIFRGIMRNEASGVFNAITKMNKSVSKSETDQSVKVLMLSEKARAEANPILLIDEYDVVAGHAASVGPVDPEDIYYLMSRGISREEAERLIIYGFLAMVVSRMPIEAMKDQLEAIIEGKLLG